MWDICLSRAINIYNPKQMIFLITFELWNLNRAKLRNVPKSCFVKVESDICFTWNLLLGESLAEAVWFSKEISRIMLLAGASFKCLFRTKQTSSRHNSSRSLTLYDPCPKRGGTLSNKENLGGAFMLDHGRGGKIYCS
jgi:hypothetical protein